MDCRKIPALGPTKRRSRNTSSGTSGEVVLTLGAAVRGRRRVSLRHRSDTGETTERELDPYGVVHREGYWYAVGYDHLREGMRIFRLDRVLEAGLLEATFFRPRGFDTPDGVLEALADMPQDRWSVEVLLETTPERAREQVPSMRVSLERVGEGVLMRCSTSDLGWMSRVLASLSFPFVVRRPPEQREALGLRAAEIAALAGRPGVRG
jgi:predicted DNA-binding transcriptional regulator YafY